MKNRADVVIVGGGIIGCSVAAELASRGADVVLLERNEIAHGASGRNHGLVFYPQDQTTEALYRRSVEIYRELALGDIDIAFDTEPRGFIIMVARDSEWEAAEAEAKACAVGNVDIERLEAEDLRRLEPETAPGLLGGWFINDGYRLDPAALTLATALKARRAGAEVITHTDVKQVMVSGARVRGVATDAGSIAAPLVVDAAGPWAPKVARSAGSDVAVTGARGWLLLTESISPITNHLLESSGWHLTAGDPGPQVVTVEGYARGELPAAPDIGLLIQQNRSGHVLLGGSRLSSMREEPEGHEVTIEIAKRAVAAVPALSKVAITAVWSGVRPMSRDGLPLIGGVPGVEGLWVVGGHGGQGVMLGAGSAALAADLINGDDPYTDASRFDPGRPSLKS